MSFSALFLLFLLQIQRNLCCYYCKITTVYKCKICIPNICSVACLCKLSLNLNPKIKNSAISTPSVLPLWNQINLPPKVTQVFLWSKCSLDLVKYKMCTTIGFLYRHCCNHLNAWNANIWPLCDLVGFCKDIHEGDDPFLTWWGFVGLSLEGFPTNCLFMWSMMSLHKSAYCKIIATPPTHTSKWLTTGCFIFSYKFVFNMLAYHTRYIPVKKRNSGYPATIIKSHTDPSVIKPWISNKTFYTVAWIMLEFNQFNIII